MKLQIEQLIKSKNLQNMKQKY